MWSIQLRVRMSTKARIIPVVQCTEGRARKDYPAVISGKGGKKRHKHKRNRLDELRERKLAAMRQTMVVQLHFHLP